MARGAAVDAFRRRPGNPTAATRNADGRRYGAALSGGTAGMG
jgi:hypothetical protein